MRQSASDRAEHGRAEVVIMKAAEDVPIGRDMHRDGAWVFLLVPGRIHRAREHHRRELAVKVTKPFDARRIGCVRWIRRSGKVCRAVLWRVFWKIVAAIVLESDRQQILADDLAAGVDAVCDGVSTPESGKSTVVYSPSFNRNPCCRPPAT